MLWPVSVRVRQFPSPSLTLRLHLTYCKALNLWLCSLPAVAAKSLRRITLLGPFNGLTALKKRPRRSIVSHSLIILSAGLERQLHFLMCTKTSFISQVLECPLIILQYVCRCCIQGLVLPVIPSKHTRTHTPFLAFLH